MVTVGRIVRRGGWRSPVLGATALVGSLGALALPAALGGAVDAVVAGGDSRRWLALAAGVIMVNVACDLVNVYVETRYVAGTAAWLRRRLMSRLLAIGPRAASRFDTGDLVSRVASNAVDAARAGPAVVSVIASVVPPAGCLVLLVVIDPWVAAAFLAGVGLVALVLRAFSRRTAQVATDYQRSQGRLAARLAESLAGARTIAAAGTLALERRRVLEPLPELRRHGGQIWSVLARSSAQAAVVGPVVLVAVLAVGGLSLVEGRISPGELFAASRYAALGAGLGGLTGVLGQLARARAGVTRAAEVLDVPPMGYGGRGLPDGSGRLALRGVTVVDGDRVLLDGIDLAVPGGAAVAVVGRSGAGKSTLAAVAARLRDPDTGRVLLDGVPLADLDHDTLRSAVGYAFERPVLVGDTVADAIALGVPAEADLTGRDGAGHTGTAGAASTAPVMAAPPGPVVAAPPGPVVAAPPGPVVAAPPGPVAAAARATRAHEFISRLPRGYDTPLAEAPLSGGEVQRIGLARAWRARRLLVLDDATSSLDTVTEMQISRTLTEEDAPRTPARTRLIVTHRAATAARADLVVWLDQGRVRAFGPHARLWTDPAYREVFGS